MTDRKSYFIRSSGPDEEAVKKASGWLIPKKKVFLAVLGYGNLEGVISDIIGQHIVKRLKNDCKVLLLGTEVILVIERKLIYNAKDAPIVAIYPTSKFLDQLDSIPNVSEMLVVPWNFEEVEPWIRAWNATELGATPQARPSPLISNPVVQQALKSLTAVVNVSTGISHPRDRATAIQTFEILRDGGEMFTPEKVKAWLIAEGGWKATDAQEVAEVAQKVLEYRRLRKGRPVWKRNILEIWREEAAKNQKLLTRNMRNPTI